MSPWIPDEEYAGLIERITALEGQKLTLADLPYDELIQKLGSESSFKGRDLLLKRSVGNDLLGNGVVDSRALADRSVTNDALADDAVDERVLNLAAPTWTAPTLLNSWVNFGSGGNSVGYWKDPSGIVHLRGLVKSGTPSSTSVIFVLPADHRPAGDHHHFAVASNAAFGFCRVDTDGDVIAFSGSGTWFSLDGITFNTT